MKRVIYDHDTEWELTKDQAEAIWNKGLTLGQVQNRVDTGWDFFDAVELGKNYVLMDGDICLKYDDHVRTLYIPLFMIDKLGIRHDGTRQLSYNLSTGKSLKNAVSYMFGGIFDRKLAAELAAIDDTEILKDRQLKNMRQRARQAERRRELKEMYRIERDKERRPHMYDGTKQQHSFGEYAQYLADSYTFKCKEATR
jgi:hypothetical protein